VRFEVVTVVTLNITVFLDVATYILLVSSVSEEVATSVFRVERYSYICIIVYASKMKGLIVVCMKLHQ
jgi:hypothetical protein